MTITAILLYTGWEEYFSDAIASLKVQSRSYDELIIIDASQDRDLLKVLKRFKDEVPSQAVVLTPKFVDPVLFKDALNCALKKCTSDYVFFLPVQHMLAPTYIEMCARELDENASLAAVACSIRLIGFDEAIVEVSIGELLAFPERDSFAMFRASTLREFGAFNERVNQKVFAEVLLSMIARNAEVKFLQEWLVLARYEKLPHKPSLHRLEFNYERDVFLETYRDLVQAHAVEIVSCIEKEHCRQQAKFDSVIDHAHKNLLFVSKKQAAQEKLHQERLSSIRVTGYHLLKAVKRRLLMSSKEAT